MHIETEQEAFFLACQMETTAIQLYDRAMLVMKELGRENEELYGQLALMRNDEEDHLRQFSDLYQGLDASVEQRIILSAVAEGILFEGGLMGAVRKGLLDDVSSMLKAASDAEATSAKKYREFAAITSSEQARNALLLIAAEEDKHLEDLSR